MKSTKKTKSTGSCTQKKIGKVMHEFKEGKLRSGSGQKVTSRDQMFAIGYAEANDKCKNTKRKMKKKKNK